MQKIGIIGGGQLGKMMILDGKRLAYSFTILDPTKDCPAHSIADEHIVAGFDDIEAINDLAAKVDVVTYEFEHININALKILEAKGHKVYPSSITLSYIQNKLTQKQWLKKHSFPVPEFTAVTNITEIKMASEKYGYPLVLKTCTGGYDGKGNTVIQAEDDIERSFQELGSGKVLLMAEQFVPFEKEISVLACRSVTGEIKIFPVAENLHKDSILDETLVPARITKIIEEKAVSLAKQAIEVFEGYGMLCMELFVQKDGRLLVNELAPRPHNSGHYTIEACETSQYENHLRGILGQPLGETSLRCAAVMKNLIGSSSGNANVEGVQKAYQYPGIKIHVYGKTKVSIGRKMGHITALAATVEEALSSVREAHKEIHFK